ncbi:MAG TPA: HU family DNA-binding protein [Candidatus Baltobacteraceae bacterium]|nr:HU family DNA-binding protein [Candidatus Baltobacteraceae bacterium]
MGEFQTLCIRRTSMAKPMTKAQTVTYFSDKLGVARKVAAAFLDEQARLAAKEAKNGFTIAGLGKLVLVNRKARMGRNPQTGEAIKIPARRVVRFRVGKAMKDAVLGGKK